MKEEHDETRLPAREFRASPHAAGTTMAVTRARTVLARLSVAGSRPFPALVSGDRAQALAGWSGAPLLRGAGTMEGLLDHWCFHAGAFADARLDENRAVPLDGFTVHAPLQPRQVYCTIGNYACQLLEAALDAQPGASHEDALAAIRHRGHGEPYIAMKPATSVSGPYASLPLPADVLTLDWEVELGVVIGRAAWRIDAAVAMDHVAGYCTVNDITLRERLFRDEPRGLGTDFLQAKGGPGWLPVGPWLVPASAVPDVAALRLELKLNGRTMQEGAAGSMIFGVAEQIAYLSRHVRLEPGDLVCTGSPAGFGSHHKRFLRPGDVVEAEVSGLGRQRLQITSTEN